MTISRTCFGLALKVAILLWIPVQSARTEALPVRIGAWNLEHLGSRTEPQRTNADLNALASKIRELGVSVLAVSEVNGWRALRDLAQRIGPSWDGVLGRSGYIGGKPPKQLGVGFLWDTNRLELVSATDWKSLPRRRDGLHIFHRVPVSACFRAVDGGPDFRLVAVHLKAGFEPSDRTKRLIELAEIKRRLEELKQTPGEDTDIAVVGDFNHGHSSPEHSTLSKSGFATYLSPPQPTSSIIHFDEQIDHIVPLAGFEEIRQNTFRIPGQDTPHDKTAWRAAYSDHYHIAVELSPTPDDDPESTFSTPEASLNPVSQFYD